MLSFPPSYYGGRWSDDEEARAEAENEREENRMPNTNATRRNRQRAYHGETIVLYGAGSTEPDEDRVTDVLTDIGHWIGPENLLKLTMRAYAHVCVEQEEEREN